MIVIVFQDESCGVNTVLGPHESYRGGRIDGAPWCGPSPEGLERWKADRDSWLDLRRLFRADGRAYIVVVGHVLSLVSDGWVRFPIIPDGRDRLNEYDTIVAETRSLLRPPDPEILASLKTAALAELERQVGTITDPLEYRILIDNSGSMSRADLEPELSIWLATFGALDEIFSDAAFSSERWLAQANLAAAEVLAPA